MTCDASDHRISHFEVRTIFELTPWNETELIKWVTTITTGVTFFGRIFIRKFHIQWVMQGTLFGMYVNP